MNTTVFNKKYLKQITLFSFVCYFLLGFSWKLYGPLITKIVDEFGVNLTFMGLSLSLNSAGCIISVLLSGRIAYFFGKKNTIILGSIFYLASFVIIFFSKFGIQLLIFNFIFGFGAGFIISCVSPLISDLYGTNNTRKLSQVDILFGIGSLLAPIAVGFVLKWNFSWRYLFLAVGVIYLILSFFLLNIKNTNVKEQRSKDDTSYFKHLKKIMNLYFIIWFISIFFHMGNMTIFLNWITTYFIKTGLSDSKASFYTTLVFLAFLLGQVLKNFLLKNFNEMSILLYSTIFSILSLIIFILFWNNLSIVIIFSLFIGFGISGFWSLFCGFLYRNNEEYSTLISSIIFSVSYSGQLVLQYFTGLLLERVGIKIFPIIIIFFCFIVLCLLYLLKYLSVKISYKKNQVLPG